MKKTRSKRRGATSTPTAALPRAASLARASSSHPIHTIYIGPENGHGRAFLTRLARATGGQTFQSTAPGLLGDGVERLLLAA